MNVPERASGRMAGSAQTAAAYVILLLAAGTAWSSGLKLGGPGARARGMAGASIGLADDLSAINGNPAGLARQKGKRFTLSLDSLAADAAYQQEVALPGRGVSIALDNHSTGNPRFSGFAAGSYSFRERWVFGLGIFASEDFGITWKSADLVTVSSGRSDIRWASGVSSLTMAPTVAFRISDRLSVGAALRVSASHFSYDRYAGNFVAPLPYPPYFEDIDLGQYRESSRGWGFGATIGLLYSPISWLSLGTMARTGSVLRLDGNAEVAGFPVLASHLARELPGSSGIQKKVNWPMSLGVGLSVKPWSDLTLAADLEWTAWSHLDSIKTDFQDPSWKIYMGERGNDIMPLFTKDVLELRMGAEYSLGRLSFRAGFRTDPGARPGPGTNMLFPSSDSFGVDFGASFRFRRWQVACGLDCSATLKDPGALRSVTVYPPSSGTSWEFIMPGHYDARTVAPYLSVSLVF